MDIQNISNNIFPLVMLGMTASLLLAGSVIFFYLRYQKRFMLQKEEIQKKELDHKKHLLYTSIQSQEEERVRISRDLHDHVGSRLSSLRLMLGKIKQQASGNQAVQDTTEESKKNIDDVINDIRNISHGLLPPGLSLWGFQHSVEDLCEKISTSSGLHVSLSDQTSGELKTMKFDTALSLYRVMQEALTNTIKHGQAQHVTITLSIKEDTGAVHYMDDGVGADMSRKNKGLGLYNIESRLSMIGASHDINTSPGNGFNLFIYNIPLQ